MRSVVYTVRIPEKTAKSLEKLSQITRRSRSVFIREAIEEALQDWEDLLIVLEREGEPEISIAQAKKLLGLR